MLTGIYPGSFDPVTYGHYDIICRSCKIVDELIVGVLNNKAKMPLFSVEERVNILEKATKDMENVEIKAFLPQFNYCTGDCSLWRRCYSVRTTGRCS